MALALGAQGSRSLMAVDGPGSWGSQDPGPQKDENSKVRWPWLLEPRDPGLQWPSMAMALGSQGSRSPTVQKFKKMMALALGAQRSRFTMATDFLIFRFCFVYLLVTWTPGFPEPWGPPQSETLNLLHRARPARPAQHIG